jgi:heme exporter protein C
MEIMKKILAVATLIVMLLALYMAFIYAPTERTMGNIQRIFYFHVPLAWVAFLAFFVVFIYSILYLWKNSAVYDRVAMASAEIGVLFTTLVLITGSVWGRAAWGAWWTWDPRLTTTLILWLIYIAYKILRSAVPAPLGARYAAVLGIVGFLDVPLAFLAIRWWRSIHPMVISSRGLSISPAMLHTLLISLAAFTLLYFYLLNLRVSRGEQLK